MRVSYQVQSVDGDVVTFAETTGDPDGSALRMDRAKLRFLNTQALTHLLAGPGFDIGVQHDG